MTYRGPTWIGQTVSHYEILEKLGGGGMGVVYKARDLRLGRLAALKFLPAHLDSQVDRHRFLKEARAAASLDHPNICTVYEIGEIDGEGGIFIAMACYEGETLKNKIQSGPLKIEEAIDYTVQIAAGLARAHSQGIVHRDIKPANLMITRDGQVKILDFGVAKLASETGLTRSGVSVGTVAYMSPEQIVGDPVDHRTDIWSLGVVLYEMLAGGLPFARENEQAFGYAILHTEPRPIGSLRPDVLPELERILDKALQKVPADRYQHVDEIPVDLRALRGSGSRPTLITGTTVVAAPRVSAPARRVPRLARKRLAKAAALLTAIALTVLLGFAAARQMGFLRPERPPTFKVLTYERGALHQARFTPDGQTIVFGASWNGDPLRIFQARLGSPVSSPIELPPADLLAVSRKGDLAISLDRRALLFSSHLGSGTLAQAPLLGGGARRLQEDIADADWAPGGSGLAVVRGRVSEQLEYPIGKVVYQVSSNLSSLRFSPDGTRIAFFEQPNLSDWSGSVAVLDLRTGKVRKLSEGWLSLRGLAWSASGEEIWFTGSRGWNAVLAAVRLDGRERTLLSFPADVALLDIAPDGRALLARHEVVEETKVVMTGEDRERDVSWLDGAFPVDMSDDGKLLLLAHLGEGSGPLSSVYLRDTERTSSVLLGEGDAQTLSPDGRWAAATTPSGAASRILLLPTGAGRPRTREVGLDVDGVGFFPDGRRLALVGSEAGDPSRRCYVLDMANGALRPVTPKGFICGVVKTPVSPDGKLMVGWDFRTAALYPVDGGSPRRIPYSPGEWFLRWEGTGQALFTFQQTGSGWSIYRFEVATGRRELWKEIKPADRTGAPRIYRVHISPDGRTYAYYMKRTLSKLYLVEGLE